MTVGNRRRRQPSLAQLRAFSAVAEHLHFRDAAAAIGMSQPALSGAVSALEETLGVTLVERTTRKVMLSPAGERLSVRAKAVLEDVGALIEEAEALRAPFTGVFRLGVIPTVAPYLLPTVLRQVRARYPHLDLQVHEEQTASLLEGLAAGRLDLLLLAVSPPAAKDPPVASASSAAASPAAGGSGRGHSYGTPGVTEMPLFDEDFVLVTPPDHPLGGRVRLPRAVLRELNLLLLDEGHCLRDQALDICREAGRAGVAATTTAAGLSTLVQLVAGGLGVTLLPRTAVEVETSRAGRLRTACFTDPAPSRRIALAMRTGAARAAEYEELAAALREAMADLPVRIVPDAA
ncbi:LysR family transcriptional regulator [Streptomyces sp. M2CJ-2]|uniref:LysR substrate-binding domain-containing protein n=1 Tax=Streptomyces sp. M2CJ-2 TaxID=2803948 RepID=UPI001920BC9C|nr:LysR substrate-binding domain-containing protein [Streptomyces sp. M2CJ-2]MBL3665776.1 LysR family transcriptional regulator [Streptomyces sp. M2CJ-2]